ncbi:MAG: hypothetical protein ACR2KJ_05815 [Jatrophihabitans sp.]
MDPHHLAELVESVGEPADDTRSRAAALARLVAALGRSARSAGLGAVAAGRWLTDTVIEVSPSLAVRDRAALRRQYPNQSDSAIAEHLVATAMKASAAIGAAAGGLSAVEFVAPPALLAVPVQLAAETLCVVAIELKMVAELHEIAGVPATGTRRDQAGAYLVAWMRRRVVDPAAAGQGLAAVLGVATKRELRGVLLRRVGRSATSVAPFLAGAVAGAEFNRRATRSMGARLLAELRADLNHNDPRIIDG